MFYNILEFLTRLFLGIILLIIMLIAIVIVGALLPFIIIAACIYSIWYAITK